MRIEFTLSPLPNLTGTKPPQAVLSNSCQVIGLTAGKWKVTMLPVKEGKKDLPSAWAKFDPHTGKETWYCYILYGEFDPTKPSDLLLLPVGNNAEKCTREEAMAQFPQGSLITVHPTVADRPAKTVIFAIPTDFYNKKGSLRIALEPVG